MKITILGCGSSVGVPMIGEEMPSNPKNIRTRASIYIEGNNSSLLVDTSPDMRAQCLAHGVKKVDAIFYTHAHSDHIHGIDDVKAFNYHRQSPIKAFSNKATLDELQKRFAYCFQPPKTHGKAWYRPCLEPVEIQPMEPFRAAEFEVLPFRQLHLPNMESLGLRIGNFAYTTDVKEFPQESWEALKGLDLWVLDCLSENEVPTHLHLAKALEYIDQFKPKKAVLTHLNHRMDYDDLLQRLPENVIPAYDGLVLGI